MLQALVKWMHLLATIAWIGGMFANFFIYMPVITRKLDPPDIGKLMGSVMKRTRVVVYFSASVLILSGVLLVTLRGKESGRLFVGDPWFIYFLGKMLMVLILVLLTVYAFEILAPGAARLAAKGPSPKLQKLQKRQKATAMAGFLIGILILFLSASL